MINQFLVPPELQQFLSGVQSKALVNVVWDQTFTDGFILPTNPSTVKRVLLFSMSGYSADATPNPLEYNCYVENLDGTTVTAITTPRSA